MIRYLLVLQLPLLFLTSMMACIGVYWMSTSVTRIYAGIIVALVVLHFILGRVRERLSAPGFAIPIFLAGAAVAAWLYRPLHMGYWDEESSLQALGVGMLGVLTLAAAHASDRASMDGRYPLAGALVVVGLVWTLAMEYPAIPLLVIGLILAVALPWVGSAAPPRRTVAKTGRRGRAALARWVILLAAWELGSVIWDYRNDLAWAGHLAMGFLAAAVAAAYGARHSERALTVGAAAASGAMLSTLLSPDFVLRPAHSLAAGGALGAALSYLVDRQGPNAVQGATLPWGAGLILSLAVAQHLEYSAWRVALLIPVLLLLFRKMAASSPKTPSAAEHGA